MGQKKTKEQIAKAAAAARKSGKKKWSSGKVKDKLNNKVLLDETTIANINKEIGNMRIASVSTVSEKFKVGGSIARRIIRLYLANGKLQQIGFNHHQLVLYSGTDYLEKQKGKK